jgi:hypothetical protein
METLLAVLVTWLSINFGLPATEDYPHVAFASSTQMLELRYGVIDPGAVFASDMAELSGTDHDLQAVYDDRSRTIYLLEGWTGATPAESSILVHELVHHLQRVARIPSACAEAREKPAYLAQERWLQLFGTSLAEEFQMDAMTILVRTNCMH